MSTIILKSLDFLGNFGYNIVIMLPDNKYNKVTCIVILKEN